MKSTNKACLYLATALAAFVPEFAAAQDEAAPGASAGGYQEILVTARQREEGLSDVPLSVQALGEQELARANITDFRDITARIPGLQLDMERAVDSVLYIRGIGSSTQGAGADSPVGVFVDGVYFLRGTGALIDLFDLERVEVLKGPQSLRFGKNVTGGLISYVTKKPGDELEGRAEVTVGNYERVDVGASVRGPVSDSVSLGLTLSSRMHQGYGETTNGVGDEEDVNAQTVRGQLRWRPSDTLDVYLAADFSQHRDGGRWVDVIVPGDSHAVTFNSFFAPPIPSLPGFVLPARNAPFKSPDPRKGPHNFTGFQDSELYGVSGQIDWEASDMVSVYSLTAYRDAYRDVREDAAAMLFDFPIDPATKAPDVTSAMLAGLGAYLATVPDSYFDNGKTDDVRQFSQELRVRFNETGRFRAELGGFYLYEDIYRSEKVNFLFPDFEAITEFAFALAFGGTPATPTFAGTSVSVTTSKNNGIGVFGELGWDITDWLTIEGGLRYAYDQKDFSSFRDGLSFGAPLPAPFIVFDDDSWDAVLPTATIRIQPSEAATFYLRYAKGYKAGGWTGENSGDPLAAIVSFEPEFANTYEAGMKLALADRRLLLNATIYYTDYQDLQLNQFVQVVPTLPPDNFVVNAVNGTEAYGAEVDLTARITDSFSVFGNYAYTHCEFTGELLVEVNGTPVDLQGNTCSRTPKHAFTVGANVEAPLSGTLLGFAGADFQFTDERFMDDLNSPFLLLEDEITLNARLGIASMNDKWEVYVWGKNLTDELNLNSLFELFGTVQGTYTPPRTYGLTARYNF